MPDRLLDVVGGGESRALVVRGEPGVVKRVLATWQYADLFSPTTTEVVMSSTV